MDVAGDESELAPAAGNLVARDIRIQEDFQFCMRRGFCSS